MKGRGSNQDIMGFLGARKGTKSKAWSVRSDCFCDAIKTLVRVLIGLGALIEVAYTHPQAWIDCILAC